MRAVPAARASLRRDGAGERRYRNCKRRRKSDDNHRESRATEDCEKDEPINKRGHNPGGAVFVSLTHRPGIVVHGRHATLCYTFAKSNH